MVPENFDFPSHNVKVMFEYWIFGDIQRKIRPFRFFESFKEDLSSKDKILFSKTKRFMKELEIIGVSNGILGQGITSFNQFNKIDRRKVLEIFSDCYQHLLKKLYYGKEVSRAGDISLTTVYNKLCNK